MELFSQVLLVDHAQATHMLVLTLNQYGIAKHALIMLWYAQAQVTHAHALLQHGFKPETHAYYRVIRTRLIKTFMLFPRLTS
jgi:hypothetical protein